MNTFLNVHWLPQRGGASAPEPSPAPLAGQAQSQGSRESSGIWELRWEAPGEVSRKEQEQEQPLGAAPGLVRAGAGAPRCQNRNVTRTASLT